jgi:hypothetical protein
MSRQVKQINLKRILQELGGLPCVKQMPENARQNLCRAFFVRAHNKEHTVQICTVNSHCRAPRLTTHGELSLPCVTGRCTAKKKQLTALTPIGALWPLPCADKKRTAIPTLCRAPRSKTHGNHLALPCVVS